jgi:hypothetical protein
MAQYSFILAAASLQPRRDIDGLHLHGVLGGPVPKGFAHGLLAYLPATQIASDAFTLDRWCIDISLIHGPSTS